MGAGCGSACLTFGVSTGVGVQALRGCPLLPCCVPCLLSAFLLCLWCVMLEYGSISRFKGVFRGFYMFGVGLCCLRALRGLWGFCARVELGGFGACGVFALLFVLLSFRFPLLFCFRPALVLLPCLASALGLVLLSWLCWLAFGVGWVVVSFSLADGFRHKKKGRNSLRPLVLLWVVTLLPLELRNYCRRFQS